MLGPMSLLGPSWCLSWGPLGALVGRARAILSLPVALLGRSWGCLGPRRGRFGDILGRIGVIFWELPWRYDDEYEKS